MNDKAILKQVEKRVFHLADKADWQHLTIDQRRLLYEEWTKDPKIGGLLKKMIEPERVRVYLKDTIMGNYSRSKRINIRDLLRSMSIPCRSITKEFVKPQAVICDEVHLFTISDAKDWKVSLLNSFERARERPRTKTNKLFLVNHTSSKFVDIEYRRLIEEAGIRLIVEIVWVT